MTQEAPSFFSRDHSMCCWVYAAVPSAVAQAQQSKLWMRINGNQELSTGQFTLLLSLAPSFTPSPAMPLQLAVSIQARHLTVPHGRCLRCCMLPGVMGLGQRQTLRCEPETLTSGLDWRRRVQLSAVSLPSQLPQWYIAISLTQCWMWELPSDTSKMTGQYYDVSHNFLSLLRTNWPCSAPAYNAPHSRQSGDDDLVAAALGRWVGRDRFILLLSHPLSWSDSSFSPVKQLSWAEPVCMQEGTWGILDPVRKWMRGKKPEDDLPMPLLGTAVSAMGWSFQRWRAPNKSDPP